MTKTTKANSYKKLKKLEKNKVKIKTTPTHLPKGQNVTDTNFRVKKIVIKDQVHQHKEGELLTKKKLSCKDLLSRLNHHNAGIKQDAIYGLKELITDAPQEIIEANLAPLTEAISKLSLDESKIIRKDANKLLSTILSQVSTRLLSPLFPSLNSYLICGLTHIDNSIREDSLLLLDVLLKWTPKLCVNAAPQLLPICLDLVSNTTSNSRTLSVNLESKFTSGRWRGNVLARISTLLSIILDSHQDESQNKVDSSLRKVKANNTSFIENGRFHIPLYLSQVNMDLDENRLFHSSSFHLSKESGSFNLKDYTQALIPLLFEAFIEMVPVEQNSFTNKTSTNISLEVSISLNHIANIINRVWGLFQASEDSSQNEKWFKARFSNPFMQSLINGRFPYTIILNEEDIKRKKYYIGLGIDISSANCHRQNILLAKLTLLLTDPPLWNSAVAYLKNCLRISDKFSSEECSLLISCCQIICCSSSGDTKTFLANLDRLCQSSNNVLSNQAMEVFYSIAVNNSLSALHEDPNFQSWLEALPERLTKSSISWKNLNIIYDVARRNFSTFSTALDGLIEVILDNLPQLKIDDGLVEQEEGQLKVASLLYWVRDWDNEMLESLSKAIKNNYWGTSVTNQIKDICHLKFGENMPSEMLEDSHLENQDMSELIDIST